MKQTYFIILAFTLITLIYKIVHYSWHFSGKKLFCWLYFDHNEIVLSSNASRRVAKRMQNVLSIIAVVGLIFSAFMYFVVVK